MERIAFVLKDAMSFIQPYMPLIDSHMVSFFTCNLWDKHVPFLLKKEFNDNGSENVLEIFSRNARSDNGKFRELNAFVNAAKEMDIAQKESINIMQLNEVLGLRISKSKGSTVNGFMSIKKSHEVEIVVEILLGLTESTGVTHVIEIGDGKGYTSSLLALQHGIKVLGLEGSGQNILGAEKRISKLYKYWKNINIENLPNLLQNKNEALYRRDQVYVNINTNVEHYVVNKFPEDWPVYSLGLTGLHTCGDLSATCLELFFSNNYPLPRFLVNVGCCYHLLNCLQDQQKQLGFPLSSFLKKNSFHLSRNARMLSMQAPSKLFFSKKLPSESIMYRAVLEKLLDETFGPNYPSDRDVGRIGSKCQNFAQYVRKVSTILRCNFVMADDKLQAYYEQFTPLRGRVHFYYLMRVMLAPIIEGIILLDRLLFLKEKGLENSYLVKLFDPVVSPRCYGIIAVREDYHSHNLPPTLRQ